MRERRKSEERSLRWLVFASFVVLLLPAIAGSMTGWRWKPWPLASGDDHSPIRAARHKAVAIAQLSFAGL